ncbi:MAG: alpha/beta hydrolase, partial [Mycobacteriaceae bacterium]|nr:alpha/beta hydrolase [Mycobacteriaceae bacterium]
MALRDDPRADPRMLAAFAPFGLDLPSPAAPLDRNAPLADRRAYTAGFDEQFAQLLDSLLGSPPAVPGVTTTAQQIDGTDGNRITLYIHRPTGRAGALPGVV